MNTLREDLDSTKHQLNVAVQVNQILLCKIIFNIILFEESTRYYDIHKREKRGIEKNILEIKAEIEVKLIYIEIYRWMHIF